MGYELWSCQWQWATCLLHARLCIYLGSSRQMDHFSYSLFSWLLAEAVLTSQDKSNNGILKLSAKVTNKHNR